MVMCEYIACGRAVIASKWTGHADVISEQNARPLTRFSTQIISSNNQPSAVWFDPDLDEVIEQLEYAYQNRDEIRRLGLNAADSMKPLDWKLAAKAFHAIAVSLGSNDAEFEPWCLVERGTALAELDDLNGALVQFQKALQLLPFDADVYKSLGFVYHAMGKEQESSYCYQKATMLENYQKN